MLVVAEEEAKKCTWESKKKKKIFVMQKNLNGALWGIFSAKINEMELMEMQRNYSMEIWGKIL